MSSKTLHYGTISAHVITSGWYNKVDMSCIPVSFFFLTLHQNTPASIWTTSIIFWPSKEEKRFGKTLLLKSYAYSMKKKNHKIQNTSRMLPVNKTEAENVQVLNS